MLAMLVALALLLVSVLGVYWLLKSMGQDGVEAAAPGSCKSGRCGVQSQKTTEAGTPVAQAKIVWIDDFKRKSGLTDKEAL
jgi:hypothetical protein